MTARLPKKEIAALLADAPKGMAFVEATYTFRMLVPVEDTKGGFLDDLRNRAQQLVLFPGAKRSPGHIDARIVTPEMLAGEGFPR